MDITSTFHVSGMNCGHCVQSVTAKLSEIAGVTSVAIDLETALVTVTSEAGLSAETVNTAIEDAGFELLIPA